MAGIDMNVGRKIDTWVGPVLLALLFAVSRLRARMGGPAQPSQLSTTPPDPDTERLEPKRVLAIKLYGLGNIAMILPALEALRRSGRRHRIVFSSESATGVTAAIRAGVAIGVLDRSAFTDDLARLAEADGWAELTTSKLVLETGRSGSNAVIDAMAEAIRRAFATSGG